MRLSFRRKLMLLTLLPVTAAASLGAYLLWRTAEERGELVRFQQLSALARQVGGLAESVNQEYMTGPAVVHALRIVNNPPEALKGDTGTIPTQEEARADVIRRRQQWQEIATVTDTRLAEVRAAWDTIDTERLTGGLRERFEAMLEGAEAVRAHRGRIESFVIPADMSNEDKARTEQTNKVIDEMHRPYKRFVELCGDFYAQIGHQTRSADLSRILLSSQILLRWFEKYELSTALAMWCVYNDSINDAGHQMMIIYDKDYEFIINHLSNLSDPGVEAVLRPLMEAPELKETAGAFHKIAEVGMPGPYGYKHADYTLARSRVLDVIYPEVRTQLTALTEARTEAAIALATRRLWIVGICVVTSVILTLVVGFRLGSTLHHRLHVAIVGVREGAAQIDKAAEMISQMSQMMAQTSSEQAANVEETSAALTEIAAMTDQNTRGAASALGSIQGTAGIVDRTTSHVLAMQQSMTDMSHRSRETQKIVKEIDEIAFQTNILALNAAVEAARAGAAGAGFAVVADEVRALAHRAAKASQETTAMIEQSVKSIGQSTGEVNAVAQAFMEIRATQETNLREVEGISAASREQNTGLSEVNRAVIDLEKMTQESASHAEQCAATAEELRAQSETLTGLVVDLAGFVLEGGAEEGMTGGGGVAGERAPGASVVLARPVPTVKPGSSRTLTFHN